MVGVWVLSLCLLPEGTAAGVVDGYVWEADDAVKVCRPFCNIYMKLQDRVLYTSGRASRPLINVL
jgi:hypothetical protein